MQWSPGLNRKSIVETNGKRRRSRGETFIQVRPAKSHRSKYKYKSDLELKLKEDIYLLVSFVFCVHVHVNAYSQYRMYGDGGEEASGIGAMNFRPVFIFLIALASLTHLPSSVRDKVRGGGVDRYSTTSSTLLSQLSPGSEFRISPYSLQLYLGESCEL